MRYNVFKLQQFKGGIMKLIAFILLIIGTIGLLVNEFVFDWGRAVTITFAIFNLVGFATLAFSYWRTRDN